MAQDTYGSITALIRATVDDRDQAGGVVFGDADLLPFVNAALLDLNIDLIDIGSPLALKDATVSFAANVDTVLDYTVANSLGYKLPSDLWAPRVLVEKNFGDPVRNYVEMDQTPEHLPDLDTTDRLRHWQWWDQQIVTLGAISARDVRITYFFQVASFTQASDVIPFPGARTVLAYHSLYKAAISRGDAIAAQYAQTEYEKAWDQYKRMSVHAKQWRSRRRFPYGMRSYRYW